MTPAEKLADALDALKSLQDRQIVAIRSTDLTRPNRERLVSTGFLQPVIKGWYVAAAPDQLAGDSTAWYTSYWGFVAEYLDARFGAQWCLSPEQSLALHAGNRTVPRQLLVRAPKGRNQVTPLPHDTSLLEVRAAMPDAGSIVTLEGLRAFSLSAALIGCSPRFFHQNATDARVALVRLDNAPELVRHLLAGGHATIAGRLAAAFRNIGRARMADDIVEAMRDAGFTVRERDPFVAAAPVFPLLRSAPPVVQRLRLMWGAMRGVVLERFPAPPGNPEDIKQIFLLLDEAYTLDAYHSLSIEGYRVSPALIERVRSGAWNPTQNKDDHAHRDAMAARGYWQAFQAVRDSVRRVVTGENPGRVAEEDHRTWYRQLFAPSVVAGIVEAADLTGYRTLPVYIRRSMHVPPSPSAVVDAMEAFFDIVSTEPAPAVRVVLGHFLFVYIHPYMDGNGRLGRFLMNVMLVAGGYPWTIVPVERRAPYMAALEEASVRGDIAPFTDFLTALLPADG